MGLFKKKQSTTTTELKCLAAGCPFTCRDLITMKRHTDWAHPGKANTMK